MARADAPALTKETGIYAYTKKFEQQEGRITVSKQNLQGKLRARFGGKTSRGIPFSERL